MADDTTTAIRKKYAAAYDDKLNPTRTEFQPVSEKQRRLWRALYAYVTQEGGWVVSVPGLKVLRLEIPQGSSLPCKLSELGWLPRHVGTGVHLSPGKTPAEIFRAVDIVEISRRGNDSNSR